MYVFVETEKMLAEAIEEIRGLNQFAFDLEFDRDRHTYGFDLCLMQIGFKEKCYIIDPFSVTDLNPVFEIFEDPSIQKLVHCPGEDLRLLHSLGCHPRNIADTEVIAKLLNYEHTSLARLLENKFNIILDKKHQQSNWHIRPLRDDQLKYATDDVLYLSQLYAVLRDEAHQKGLTEWIGEEFNSLETVRYTLEVKTNFLKPGDQKNLSPWQQYILNEIFKLRDIVARKKNKPSYMIMPEQTVRDIAMGYIPYQDIQNVSGLHPSLKHGKTAKELIENIDAIFKESEKQNLDKRLNGKSYSEKEREEYRQKKDLQKQIKESIWSPVQQKMAQELGPFAARHILSNGWISKWLNGEVRWNDLQPNYKQKLILDIGKSEGIDFASITEYEKRYHH